ncbi:MAG: hypothetical protein JJ884_06080 [Maricaulis sp.]|uniref:hypothetical protein n=1 Tax=Maricaulis sp. TaxID=1486257 RepID=UPI001B0E2AB1|nr:hypothetical protein [Maricaulis sp.]MBO6728678.1 hypothetical protein [Maricaulis sp.]MBO6847070.1 hypothetical protein [Maricaulis sp.]MBO6877301.1 hypothetical protein [Maricaulis sp.]
MSLAAILSSALLALASTSADVCVPPCTLIQVAEDGSYSASVPRQGSRSTPSIEANVIGFSSFDIDGDGIEERVVIDDRESAFGSVSAVFFDVSSGDAFVAFQCQASTVETALDDCVTWYSGLVAADIAAGLDRVQTSTRTDGALDWETQHLLIPNVTTTASMLLAIQSVDLARAQLALATESEEALSALKSALLFREQRALRFTFAD